MSSEKVVIKPIFKRNPFIKTPDEVAELFGFPTSIRSQIKVIAATFGEAVTVSDRSLDNLSGKGLSERKAEEVLAPMQTILDRLNLDLDNLIPTGTSTNDLKTLWRAAIKSLVAGIELAGEDASFLQPLIAFLDRRCLEYEPQREWISYHRGMEESKLLSKIVEFYRPVIDKTALSAEQQNLVIRTFAKSTLAENFEIAQDEMEAMGLFTQDFNLSLFAALDLVAINWKHLNQEGTKQHDSFFGKILAADGKCYFGKLISFIKEDTGISYRELAQRLPIQQESTETGRTLLEVQIERLKEWRKGKTKPSFATLDKFCSNFAFEDQLLLFIYCLICQALDRQLAKYQGDEKRMLKEIYSADNYLTYYLKEKETAV
ncbi:hypothetical protein [Marinomonas flavescens]|uniref:hypothetical protein n=1 Tax=Marinomonas flavescens TaxID=2529379 RepID=UPI00105452BB|nr:hypothetical protein [Marinomonas flavescens]